MTKAYEGLMLSRLSIFDWINIHEKEKGENSNNDIYNCWACYIYAGLGP